MGGGSYMQRYGKYFEDFPDKDAALSRLGLTAESIPLTRAGLDKLQFAHLCSVPFENIDLFDYNKSVDFGVAELFDKIVTRRRGGYCFELNAFFMSLLQALGFTAHAVGGRIMPMDGSDFIPAIAHRMTVVTIDGLRYVTDVGFGMTSAPGGSICLDTYDEQEVCGDIFTVENIQYNNKLIWRHKEEGPSKLFMFNPDPMPIVDFVAINNNMSLTGFRVKRTANLRTPDGAISVDGDIFRVTKGSERTETPISGPEEAYRILTERYGMILDEPLSAEAVRTP